MADTTTDNVATFITMTILARGSENAAEGCGIDLEHRQRRAARFPRPVHRGWEACSVRSSCPAVRQVAGCGAGIDDSTGSMFGWGAGAELAEQQFRATRSTHSDVQGVWS